MKQLKIPLSYFELFLSLIPIIPIVSLFPTGSFLTENGCLTGFWTVPVVFWMATLFLESLSKDTPKIP